MGNNNILQNYIILLIHKLNQQLIRETLVLPQSLRLPLTLRNEMKNPMGNLIAGSIEETIPILKKELKNREGILVGVGDVTAEILVNNDFNPEIIITDGYTKREKLAEWLDYPQYKDVHTQSPAAEISKNAWETIILAVKEVSEVASKIHIKVDGEEDLLVLPLILELPNGSKIIYGQPNQGAVIRLVNTESKAIAQSLMERMEVID